MKYLMYLYSCAARSKVAVPPEYNVDFEELFSVAGRMSLMSTLSYALKISPEIQCPMEIRSRLYSVMIGTSLKNKMKIEAILRILDDLERVGIKVVVLKGLDCARYYSKPECRISADTDLFVDSKDEERIFSYFEQKGFVVRRRKKHEHHGECESKETGIFEIHTKIWEDEVYSLMPERIKKIKKCIETSVCIFWGENQIRVMRPTNALMFMTLHFVKHFIFGGANLKMSYDLVLYYVNNKDLIDGREYKQWVKKAGYEKIVSAVFSAMSIYCDFDKDDIESITCFNSKLGERFAESIEQYDSCNFEERPDIVMMIQYCTNQSNIRKKGRGYAFLYNAKEVFLTKFPILFPKISHLEKDYPYLKKYPFLYLCAVTHRFFKRGTKHVFHGNPKNGSVMNYKENLEIQLSEKEKKQIETLKMMGLI